jgi:hypothetical protein
MSKILSAALAGAIALAGLAAPVQAALVTYNFWSTSVTATRSDYACASYQGCAPTVTNFGISRVDVAFVVDTAAGMAQFADPDGGAGSTFLRGGEWFGLPIGVTASVQITGAPGLNIGPFAATNRSQVYGSAGYAQFSAEDGTYNTSLDTQTGDTLYDQFSRGLFIDMFNPGPITQLGGEWLPGMSGLASGSLSLFTFTESGRVAASDNSVTGFQSIFELTAANLNFGSGPPSVPEPGAIGLLGFGLALVAAGRQVGRQTGALLYGRADAAGHAGGVSSFRRPAVIDR